MIRHATLALLVALPASAWNPGELIGRHDKPLLEPEGYYQVVVPSGFDCAQRDSLLGPARARKGSRTLQCTGMRGARADLRIAVRDVPRSATSALVALNEVDKAKKQEHFKELERRKLQLGQLEGVILRYRFNRFGHISHPAQVVALFAVAKGKLFEIRFESREDQIPRYQEDLEQLFASFRPAQLDEAGRPIIKTVENKKKKIVRPKTDEEFIEKRLQKQQERLNKKKKKKKSRSGGSGW